MKQNKTYIIAEAGVNHNGDLGLAKELINQAAMVGADAIKFQTFNADLVSHPMADQAEYQKRECGEIGQHGMLKQLELSKEQFIVLKEFAEQQGIDFLSTAFDLESLDFLLSLDLPYIKVSSGDLSFGSLLLKIAQSNKQVLISTGMATMADIRNALNVLAYGYKNPSAAPSSFYEITASLAGEDLKTILYDKVVVFHCTSEYPAPPEEINLNVIDMLRDELGLRVGYSDHSLGILVPQLAVAKGAIIIEKHFTLDNNLPGPDHKASLNPHQFSEMVQQIRQTELYLGTSHKNPTNSELKNKPLARRGIYARSKIVKGEVLAEEKLVCLRPEAAHSPLDIWEIMHKTATRDYEIFEEINV